MKYIIYLFPAILLFTFYSCDSKNEASYALEGQWRVIERRFDCPDDPKLEKRVNEFVRVQREKLKKGEWEYLSFANGSNYKEGDQVWEYIGGGTSALPLDSFLIDKPRFTGNCTIKDEKHTDITIGNIGQTWQYSLQTVDLNNEFIRTEQEMDKESIEIFLEKYLNFPNRVEQGIVAVWKTKASRVKE